MWKNSKQNEKEQPCGRIAGIKKIISKAGENKKVAIGIGAFIAVAVVLAAVCLIRTQLFSEWGSRMDGTREYHEAVEVLKASIDEGNHDSVFFVDERAIDREEAAKAKKSPLQDRNVFFAGFMDCVLPKDGTVRLENLPENEDFLMRYVISDVGSGECVFETGMIPSGQAVVWKPGETLDAGEHRLEFLMIPYSVAEDGKYSALTSGSNEVCIEIRE